MSPEDVKPDEDAKFLHGCHQRLEVFEKRDAENWFEHGHTWLKEGLYTMLAKWIDWKKKVYILIWHAAMEIY